MENVLSPESLFYSFFKDTIILRPIGKGEQELEKR
jgi:hypothetical protein